MIELRFEWHESKAKANLRTHGVSFELAKSVFDDPLAMERVDAKTDYGEKRFIIVGAAKDGFVLLVVYTERDDLIRIISARRATGLEEQDYFRQNT
jgi:uncharacterized protein